MARVSASVSLRLSGWMAFLDFGRGMGLWGFGVAMIFCLWGGGGDCTYRALCVS